jgi:light-regulated signal transduction histidine kinase (bacteriophytochrome)/CheY-like chemotaxis protein
MVYRFDEKNSGEVIAEALGPKMESFLGLNFPASDIPKQARALYQRNMLRVIGDVNDAGIEIIPTLNPHGEPLDLSMSTTRAVSPIHLEYLRNMDVGGSMSISILKDGKLWGLFACHHPKSLVPSYPVRTAAELFAQLFTYLLERKETIVEREAFMRGQILHDRIMVQLATDTSVSDNFDMIAEATQAVIPFDGAVGWIDGVFQSRGAAPTEEEFKALIPFLNTSTAGRVFETDHLSGVFPGAAAYAERAAGLLVLPVSRSPRDYIVFFRSEVARTVTWAGNPDKPALSDGEFGSRLHPRESFEAWQQEVAGHCAPWTDEQTRAAEALRVTLMEVVLRLADTNIKDQAKAHERQELLIAELNHRVRNILNLIKGLINQSADGHNDVSSLTGVIGGRIDALARAHDQITRQHWAPASLYDLIETECDAYLGIKADRIFISGPDAMLNPDAFSSLSLVIHELMTNSAKYGALCDSQGRVFIDITQESDGSLTLEWREKGGPAVQAPTRRGFGTTIIERSIPYELQGTAVVRYELTGVEVDLGVPAVHIDRFTDRQKLNSESLSRPAETDKHALGHVLVVEDNMIIALDAELLMEELGAETVNLAASVDHALDLIESTDFGFALLDVNLGSETSVPVAEALRDRNIPFAFATGYGETSTLKLQFPDARTIQKPYDIDDLRSIIA